ncbi:CidA/LrgA family protein [Falsigemmobacter intermedius]|uniref:CidA/LrgA family protein n=1 Tax=Falsigemmobacter intermedius TaxID=1553448 RepID=A0A3S3UVH2_9RHOB|nr:CidA/LrgA family protein [Falsigemmobacter intermedius]RWY41066.1 CidA/LrgA family protein [Falsigemmobacter intermedius]
MIFSVTLILLFQLAGVVLVQLLHLPVPGPVAGMALLLIAMLTAPALYEKVRPAGQGILQHLSLLFVPAGVGVVGHIGTLGDQGWGIAVALIGSTVLALLAGVFAFLALAKLTGSTDD